MAQPDRELGEFLRRSMRAMAESVAVGEDGLGKIWTRLAASRQSAVADHRQTSVKRKTRLARVAGEHSCVPTSMN